MIEEFWIMAFFLLVVLIFSLIEPFQSEEQQPELALTSLLNRRALQEQLEEECEGCPGEECESESECRESDQVLGMVKRINQMGPERTFRLECQSRYPYMPRHQRECQTDLQRTYNWITG
jgi:hypothetical protein